MTPVLLRREVHSRSVRAARTKGPHVSVWAADRPEGNWPYTKVVLGHVPTPGLGTDSGDAQSGRDAVTDIERKIEVEVPVQVVQTVEVKVARTPRGSERMQALHELA